MTRNRRSQSENEANLSTRYPIILVHGVGFRDWGSLYWGRIADALRAQGARVYFGTQDAWGAVEDNAQVLLDRVREVVAQEGCGKVNIIAHSKGGLDSRYMISVLGGADMVASLTTVSTPHRGSETMDWLLRMPKPIMKIMAFFVNLWFRLLGDKKPQFERVCHQFSTHGAAQLNEIMHDAPEVEYASVCGTMKRAEHDLLMLLPYLVVRAHDGANDGLVGCENAKWGKFLGVWDGYSHLDEIDLRRRNRKIHAHDDEQGDVCTRYTALCQRLCDMGL